MLEHGVDAHVFKSAYRTDCFIREVLIRRKFTLIQQITFLNSMSNKTKTYSEDVVQLKLEALYSTVCDQIRDLDTKIADSLSGEAAQVASYRGTV
jgi:hypothetical protein